MQRQLHTRSHTPRPTRKHALGYTLSNQRTLDIYIYIYIYICIYIHIYIYIYIVSNASKPFSDATTPFREHSGCEDRVAAIIARETGCPIGEVGRRPFPASSLMRQRIFEEIDRERLRKLSDPTKEFVLSGAAA